MNNLKSDLEKDGIVDWSTSNNSFKTSFLSYPQYSARPLIPGFSWPEDKTEMPESTKKILREADKAVEDANASFTNRSKKAGKN